MTPCGSGAGAEAPHPISDANSGVPSLAVLSTPLRRRLAVCCSLRSSRQKAGAQAAAYVAATSYPCAARRVGRVHTYAFRV